jgi:riboflavin biosynthesis pyrimidine reductase
MAGTATIAAEGYGRLIRDPARRAARTARGLEGDPLAVMITRSGDLPLEAPIFAAPEQRIAAFVPVGCEYRGVAARLELTHLDPVEPEIAFEMLGAGGIRSILCEGGPRVVSGLAAANLIDDVFLTVAPKLAGGGRTGLVDGPPLRVPRQLELAAVAERAGSLFIHWRSRPS